MKKHLHRQNITAIILMAILLQACNGHYDKQGRLLADDLKSSSGKVSFTPMMRNDSESVHKFVPDTFTLNGKPYTGEVAEYNKAEQILLDGFVKNGLMDSTWKFYYASGGVRLEGLYKNGMDIGLWRAYYGYNKPRIDKLYDDYGYLLMRIEYFDNGKVKDYENVKCPLFDNKERSYSMSRTGEVISLYVEDSVLILKHGSQAERVGRNIFAKPAKGNLNTVK